MPARHAAAVWRANGDRLRVLRRRAGLTQDELARRSGASRRTVQRIEAGSWGSITHDRVRRVTEALGAHLRVVLTWGGEQLDRLVDAAHAELQNAFASMLVAAGWLPIHVWEHEDLVEAAERIASAVRERT